MTYTRKEGAYARQQAEYERTARLLAERGRTAVESFINGSVRTQLWANLGNHNVPVLVNQKRLYSTPRSWGVSRCMEASDLTHVIRALNAAQQTVTSWRVNTQRPRDLGRQTVLASVDRGDNPPLEVFPSGNLAALLWANVAAQDFVVKVELLTVVAPGCVERFFLASQIDDARKCYANATSFMTKLQQRNFDK